MTRRDRETTPLSLVPGHGPEPDPRVRPERIALAKERIRQHYYDRSDVRRALVEALIVELAAP